MNIKIVKNPVSKYPECKASYDHENKTILIKKYTRHKDRKVLIFHEYGHYLVDILFVFPILKHYLNLLWEYIWILLDPVYYNDRKEHFTWITNYYKEGAEKKEWVY